MRRTSIPWLVGAAVIAFAVAWAVVGVGNVYVAVPWPTAVVLVLLAGGLWLGGRAVKRLVDGERGSISPIAAARIAALAQASAWGGSLVVGYFVAQALVAGSNMHASFATGHLWSSIACGAAALLLVVVGLVVEHWCSIPPGEDDAGARSPSSGAEPA